MTSLTRPGQSNEMFGSLLNLPICFIKPLRGGLPCMNGGEGDHGALRRSVGWAGGTAVPGRRGTSACRGIHRQARYRSWHRGGAGPRLGRGARAWLGLRGKPAELAGRVRQDSARREPRRILVAIGRHQRADLDRRDQPGGSAVRVRAGVHGGHRHRTGWHSRISRGALCQLAGHHESAVARGARRPAGPGGPGWPVAGGPGGPAAGHQQAVHARLRSARDAGRPGGVL